jgi:lysophospholipase L1-like esterase
VVEPGSLAGQSPAGPADPAPPAGAPDPPASGLFQSRQAGTRPFAAGSFVALGDSFSEGVGDDAPDGSVRGWADRLAAEIAAHSPGLRYANLAIRGKLLAQVISEQVPAAVAMRPDLVTIAAGGNDLLRPRVDPDALAEPFSAAVADLVRAGSQVVLFAGFDPGMFPLIRMIRRRAAVFNSHLRIIARQQGCILVDLWGMTVLNDPRMWCEDRLHLNPEGHQRVALCAAETMGLPVATSWREPLPPPGGPPGWLPARRRDVHWAREYALPWARRRLAGVSSGDNMPPKRPDLLPLP